MRVQNKLRAVFLIRETALFRFFLVFLRNCTGQIGGHSRYYLCEANATHDANHLPTGNETMKTRTCLRCKGTGFRNTPVVHLGVPGLCYGCNGSKKQRWFTIERLNEIRDNQWERELSEIKRDGENMKTVLSFLQLFGHLSEGSKCGERRVRRRTRDLTKLLTKQRERWTNVKRCQRNDDKQTRGKWMP